MNDRMKFTKMHGCGNDYVYVNGFTEKLSPQEKPEIVRKLSDRHFGIGGDGVIFINPAEEADFEMEMYNADGSRSEMCGNGIRCVARLARERYPEATGERFAVTSGGYQRYFEQDGVRYHHILDPKTGRPAASGLQSVSVVSQDDTLADALSTALFVMGLDAGAALYRAGDLTFEAVFMTDDGSVWITPGLAGQYQSDRPYQVLQP